MKRSRILLSALAVLALGASVRADLELPDVSQLAHVKQRVGLTDIKISYHRPLVNGRKIWGGLVPLGEVWRAGANENTTIDFSSDVTVEGQALPKGTYGLHMIPTADTWTVIFSKMSTAWGSYTYDQKEDALRVTVKPRPTEMTEALDYVFEDLKEDSATMTLKWEKIAVPVKIAVSPEATVANIRPMNESTISTAEMSITTPAAPDSTMRSARSSCSASTDSSAVRSSSAALAPVDGFILMSNGPS